MSGTPPIYQEHQNISQLTEQITTANQAAANQGRSLTRSVDLMVSPVPIPGMDDINTISGSTSEVVEVLNRFSDAGFAEVHCYGPAPSTIRSDAWRPIIEAVHSL